MATHRHQGGIALQEKRLRNSYNSYRLAQTKDLNVVAYESGNSPEMIRKYYSDLGLPGRGKRGGCRVIYLHVKSAPRIYFVYLYPKTEEVDLSAEQKRALKQIAHSIYEEAKKDPSFK